MDGRILYNPLAVLGKGKGFLAAIVVVIALTAVACWGGVHLAPLYPQLSSERPSAMVIIGESLVAWLTLGFLLLAFAKVSRGNSGLGAHLAAAGLSRFPYILAAIVMSRQLLGKAILEAMRARGGESIIRSQAILTPGLIIAGFAILGLVIWAIVILYLGYKQASRLQGGRAAASFVIGVLLAEAISKLLVWLLI
ncbi:MAG TPA: YIP1 family protein [Armatimonadota bacterium]|nr:YIP1 family protein [Armatimonadota bacterium]